MPESLVDAIVYDATQSTERIRAAALAAADDPSSALDPVDAVAAQLVGAEFADRITPLMPPGLDARTIIGDAVTALRTVRDLDRCPPATILGGVITAAQLGLRIGVLGHSWLIPRYNTTAERYVASLTIGYKGWTDLAYRSGLVKSVSAFAITKEEWENGRFSIRRTADGDVISHEPMWTAQSGKPAQEIGWYARIVLATGGHICPTPWNAARMAAHRDAYAPSKNGKIVGPWKEFPAAMARKTVLLEALKQAPTSPSMSLAMSLDGAVRGDDGAVQEHDAVDDDGAVGLDQ